MSRRPNRRRRGRAGKHVQLHEWFQQSEAWATLKPGPRALYIELKRRFNGHNNGRIVLSHRDAAAALNVHRNTISPWLEELRERGLIRMTQGPCLGPSGIGQSAHWALEEEPTDDMKPAGKAFMRWRQAQNPRTEKRTPRPSQCDAGEPQRANTGRGVLNTVT